MGNKPRKYNLGKSLPPKSDLQIVADSTAKATLEGVKEGTKQGAIIGLVIGFAIGLLTGVKIQEEGWEKALSFMAHIAGGLFSG